MTEKKQHWFWEYDIPDWLMVVMLIMIWARPFILGPFEQHQIIAASVASGVLLAHAMGRITTKPKDIWEMV